MVDFLSKDDRSRVMSRIRGKHTRPEKQMRSLLHRAGYRFRLHSADLPGHPDIVMRKYRTVVFVHGCYWHRHRGCKNTTTPGTRTEFWKAKFAATVERDRRNTLELEAMGWQVITVWECELKKTPQTVLESVRVKLGKGQ
jgi:DNA mismatch endonuclease (patch repair protein)